jgi:hypothetical protein
MTGASKVHAARDGYPHHANGRRPLLGGGDSLRDAISHWKRSGETRRINAMEGRGKFDKYTKFWRDVERTREDIYIAQWSVRDLPPRIWTV